jgi:hypothetical protein
MPAKKNTKKNTKNKNTKKTLKSEDIDNIIGKLVSKKTSSSLPSSLSSESSRRSSKKSQMSSSPKSSPKSSKKSQMSSSPMSSPKSSKKSQMSSSPKSSPKSSKKSQMSSSPMSSPKSQMSSLSPMSSPKSPMSSLSHMSSPNSLSPMSSTFSNLEKLVLGYDPRNFDVADLRAFLKWVGKPQPKSSDKKELEDIAIAYSAQEDPDGAILRKNVMRLSREFHNQPENTIDPKYELEIKKQTELMRKQILLFNDLFAKKISSIDDILKDSKYPSTKAKKLTECRTLLKNFINETNKSGVVATTPNVVAGSTQAVKEFIQKTDKKDIAKALGLGVAALGAGYAAYKQLSRNDVQLFLRSTVEYVERKLGIKETSLAKRLKQWMKNGHEELSTKSFKTNEELQQWKEAFQNWLEKAPSQDDLEKFKEKQTDSVLSKLLKPGADFTKYFRRLLKKIPYVSKKTTFCEESTPEMIKFILRHILSVMKPNYVANVLMKGSSIIRSNYLDYLAANKNSETQVLLDVQWYLLLLNWFDEMPSDLRIQLGNKITRDNDKVNFNVLSMKFNEEESKEICEWIFTYPKNLDHENSLAALKKMKDINKIKALNKKMESSIKNFLEAFNDSKMSKNTEFISFRNDLTSSMVKREEERIKEVELQMLMREKKKKEKKEEERKQEEEKRKQEKKEKFLNRQIERKKEVEDQRNLEELNRQIAEEELLETEEKDLEDLEESEKFINNLKEIPGKVREEILNGRTRA